MSTTITFSDTPAGVENHTDSSIANTGTELQLEITGVKNTVDNIITPDADSKEYNPFPEGVEKAQLPHIVQESWKQVQVYLSPEMQSKISYYEKNGEWYINLDGTKISLKNETTTDNPSAGVYVENGHTYFSQFAAQQHAKSKSRSLPTSALWKKMATFLGGYNQLRDILQIPLVGWFRPFDGLKGADHCTEIWSADRGEYLYVSDDGGVAHYTIYAGSGLSVRLLDTSA